MLNLSVFKFNININFTHKVFSKMMNFKPFRYAVFTFCWLINMFGIVGVMILFKVGFLG